MKHNLLRFAFALILSIAVSAVTKASHLTGAYITYEYAGAPHTNFVKLHYFGCGGAIVALPFICYSSQSIGYSDTISLSQIYGPGNIVSYSYCNGNLIDCINNGMEEYICFNNYIASSSQ